MQYRSRYLKARALQDDDIMLAVDETKKTESLLFGKSIKTVKMGRPFASNNNMCSFFCLKVHILQTICYSFYCSLVFIWKLRILLQ